MKRLLFAIIPMLLVAGNAFSEGVEKTEATTEVEAEAGKWLEVEGAVARKIGASFYVGTLKVIFNEETEIVGDLTFHNNDLVRVEGTLTGPSRLTATKIEIEDLTETEDEPEAKAEPEPEAAESEDVEPDEDALQDTAS